SEFIYPEHGETSLIFNLGDELDFVCPGRTVLVEGVATEEVVRATCVSSTRFRTAVRNSGSIWSRITCSDDPIPSSRLTGRSCEAGGVDAEIGFSLRDDVCYDRVRQSPLYTYYNLTKSIGNNAKGTPRPLFSEDDGFYSLGTRTVNSLYVRGAQRATINTLIGLTTSDTKYIDGGSWYFLARGHLTARADFFYPAQQNGTFRYINAAPQWQTFNGLNWNMVEQSTRNYADRNGLDLQVWTGIYGVTTLPHESTGEDVDLYIYTVSAPFSLPVPALYWKVVYDPISRRGVALIGLNNPYLDEVSRFILCRDVSETLTWVTWNKNDLREGYSYACTIPDLRDVIPYAPDLPVTGLLL
ncbi:hypothetical protein NQ317_014323, partial [Molorchus minor]